MSRNKSRERSGHKSKEGSGKSKSKDKKTSAKKQEPAKSESDPGESPDSRSGDTDLQSWCEIPSIAHFCSLFRQAFDLLEFDIQELEESLLLMNTDADESHLVLRLLIKLLKGCSKTFTNNINEDNYNTYLRRLFLSKREELEEDNFSVTSNINSFECKALLDDDIDFPDLSLRNRVRILQQLTEYRLDAEDVFEKVKNLEANSLGVDPLGKDSENVTYWYFYGTRLYKEEGRSEGKSKKKESKKKKKKDKKKKKKKKSRRESTTTEDDGEGGGGEGGPKWSVACLTLQDWEDLAEKYKKSKKRCDKELYETIHDSFLPEIVKMYAEKEREERRKLLAMQPKRASNRIERKRREQEIRDKELAEKMEEERRLEEEYDEKVREERLRREEEEREHGRENRIKERERMKEMRAQRAIERDWKDSSSRNFLKREKSEEEDESEEEEEKDSGDDENDYEPLSKRQKKSSSSKGGSKKKRGRVKSQKERLFDDDDNLYNPFHTNDHESDEDYAPTRDEIVASTKENNKDKQETSGGGDGKPEKNAAAAASMHFTNALIKVGSKSFKDPQVEKPVRKTAGLLLETAGKSLLQRRAGPPPSAATANDRKFNSLLLGEPAKPAQLSFGLAPEKISFGLYDGNLAVESASGNGTGRISESGDRAPEADNNGTTNKTAQQSNGSSNNPVKSPTTGSSTASTKRVFSNWGGAFFKKNLDYRANTNKILEKMSMASSAHSTHSSSTTANGEGFKSAFSSAASAASAQSPTKRPFDVMSRLASPPPAPATGGSTGSSGTDTPSTSSPTVKKFKAGFSFGSSFGSPPGNPS